MSTLIQHIYYELAIFISNSYTKYKIQLCTQRNGLFVVRRSKTVLILARIRRRLCLFE